MPRTATVSRVFTFTISFESPEALTAWLKEKGITPENYTDVLESLSLTPEQADAGLKDGTLTAQVILTAYNDLGS